MIQCSWLYCCAFIKQSAGTWSGDSGLCLWTMCGVWVKIVVKLFKRKGREGCQDGITMSLVLIKVLGFYFL